MNFTNDDITFSEFNEKLVFEDGYKKSHKQKGGKYDSMFSEFDDEELTFEDDGYKKRHGGRKQRGGENDVVFSEFDMGVLKRELRGGIITPSDFGIPRVEGVRLSTFGTYTIKPNTILYHASHHESFDTRKLKLLDEKYKELLVVWVTDNFDRAMTEIQNCSFKVDRTTKQKRILHAFKVIQPITRINFVDSEELSSNANINTKKELINGVCTRSFNEVPLNGIGYDDGGAASFYLCVKKVFIGSAFDSPLVQYSHSIQCVSINNPVEYSVTSRGSRTYVEQPGTYNTLYRRNENIEQQVAPLPSNADLSDVPEAQSNPNI